LYFFSGAPVLRTAGEEFDAISMDGMGVLKLVVMGGVVLESLCAATSRVSATEKAGKVCR